MESIILSSDGGVSSVTYPDEILTANFKPLASSTPIRHNESYNRHNKKDDGDRMKILRNKETSSGNNFIIQDRRNHCKSMKWVTSEIETGHGKENNNICRYPCDDDQNQDASVIIIGIKEAPVNRTTTLKFTLKNSGRATSHKSCNRNQGAETAEIVKPKNRKRKLDSENDN